MAIGTVFNIQRFSVADGPGIRTTVFLKGCNLRCFWCHNPESWDAGRSIEVFPERCIGCGQCAEACEHGARFLEGGSLRFDRGLCQRCGACAEVCVADAIRSIGAERTAQEVLAEIERDAPFFLQSGGGVTISGGEPLLQPEFVLELLRGCSDRGIASAIDTAGHVAWPALSEAARSADLVLFDVKALDPELHRRGTGVSNSLILTNLERLGSGRTPIWIRVPLVPGFNDAESELSAIADFCSKLPAVERIEILGYHRLGEGKRGRLGLERGPDVEPPSEDALARLAVVAEAFGKPVVVR
ncbi:MAG TPA: glycyl-radical enzyme activating protein [Armatimonadetes bacterium]|jgi:glycyl-radical enzyme activating protein|nr:glycyl-radical enzyme activating protein [Armatimonadota bacterium]MCA1996558.1 glycyl-radical enzyme activating protein [Armatimonadota bacterium]HCE00322.1 glycyl-radical enzyme activating protein [Armatimonadota bacterium]